MIDIVVPDLGLSSNAVITVSCWLVGAGDEVIEGDRLVELLSDEITFDVSSPASGTLRRIEIETDEPVLPGAVLGRVQPESER